MPAANYCGLSTYSLNIGYQSPQYLFVFLSQIPAAVLLPEAACKSWEIPILFTGYDKYFFSGSLISSFNRLSRDALEGNSSNFFQTPKSEQYLIIAFTPVSFFVFALSSVRKKM